MVVVVLEVMMMQILIVFDLDALDDDEVDEHNERR